MDEYSVQANLFTRYLVKRDADGITHQLYRNAAKRGTLDKNDARLLDFVVRHHWAVGLVDAGLIFYKPESEVRRRLYMMLAILEANPSYADKFLPRKRNPLYLLVLGLIGCRAIFRIAVGSLLVRALV
jgi:hypothetical protein